MHESTLIHYVTLLWNTMLGCFFSQNKIPPLQSYFPINRKYWLCPNDLAWPYLCNANLCYLCNQLILYQSKAVEQHSQAQDGLKGQDP